jgi:glutaminyl-peptide cyclotransferase
MPPLLVLLGCVLAASGCDSAPPVARLAPQIIRTLPHDPGAYTQGLILHQGRFYESTGQYGSSTVREVDVETGTVLASHGLAEEYFGEGLDRVGDRLIQLTWQTGVAFIYDMATLEPVGTFEYEGHGWGLCHDGASLFMTNGSADLQRRDPSTFQLLETLQVTLNGSPVFQINELECVGDDIYANVFMSHRIVRIDKATGVVTAEIDASGLVPEGGRPLDAGAVLNGIAWDPQSETFYLTGKLWPTMFQVRFVEW